jgi:cytoskeletal protein CcmA (bactofilin family)
MSVPRPPPRKKNHQPVSLDYPVAGAGYNVPRMLSSYTQEKDSKSFVNNNPVISNPSNSVVVSRNEVDPIASALVHQLSDKIADTVVGKGVEIHGDLQFGRLLRIDGKFQGKLLSKGDIIIGKHAVVIADLTSVNHLVIEGGLVCGNIAATDVFVTGKAVVKGDISCKWIEVDGNQVTLNGQLYIHPLAPELIDENNNVVQKLPKVALLCRFICQLAISLYTYTMNISVNFDAEEEK